MRTNRVISDDGLRPYQQDVYHDIYNQWDSGVQNVLAELATGGGKTRILSAIVKDFGAPTCVIAHRQELVSQISTALASNGIRHNIIGPNKLVQTIVTMHIKKFGKNFYDPSGMVAVAGVDTLVRREKQLASWLPTVKLWVTDECHHVLVKNKWGKAVDMFPNAKGLGVTATPVRVDGAGLGRHADGLLDTIVHGPSMRWLIDNGYLTDYKIFAPPSDLDLSHLQTSKTTGDYNVNDVRDAVSGSSLITADEGKAQIVGDVVGFYIKKFSGMLSVVFVPSVADAESLEAQFKSKGVNAKALNGNTPDNIRSKAIEDFGARKINVLINVALFDEGFDCPAIEVVQDAYPTQSYSRFAQRFGRMLRPAPGKKFGIYCDHANNVMTHVKGMGLPDAPKEWTLDRREKRAMSENDGEDLRTCLGEECYRLYPRYKKVCPYCSEPIPEPAERNGPEFVDGDLYEIDAETLAKLRAIVADVDAPLQDSIAEYRGELDAKFCKPIHAMAHVKRFAAKLEAQQSDIASLRGMLAYWAGIHRGNGADDSEIFKRFYLKYNIDWLSAQALESKPAQELSNRLALDIGKLS